MQVFPFQLYMYIILAFYIQFFLGSLKLICFRTVTVCLYLWHVLIFCGSSEG